MKYTTPCPECGEAFTAYDAAPRERCSVFCDGVAARDEAASRESGAELRERLGWPPLSEAERRRNLELHLGAIARDRKVMP